jgi:hypothetical protein
MSNPDVEIRRATQEDLDAFYGKAVRPSCKAWIAFWKGEAACVAGISLERVGPVAFSDVKPGIDAPTITIWRTAKAMLDEMRERKLPLIVGLERCKPNSAKFLRSLGFTVLRIDEDEIVMGFMP